MVSAVIFDCFGVLLVGSQNLELEALDLSSKDTATARSLLQAYANGVISQQQIQDTLGISHTTLTRLLGNVLVRNEPLLEYIRTTIKPSYKIAMLSNTNRSNIDSYFTTDLLDQLFNELILSAEVGVAKPSADIYELVAERLTVSAADCIFIDDTSSYCRAAHDVGMQAIQYQDFNQCVADITKLLH